ncbi:MAG: sulfurtransferase TusA family protein [Thermodesulfovibrionia bacterium]|nr:sulfurtransferase TusA family protein [Thermodesulfovibrionia bacterium]MCK5512576.1 sulfurtransferase TusA family protein [Thermodesulfovibrionia bacterium]
MADLKTKTPSETLDVLGRVCPYPLVLTKKTLEKAPGGTLLKVLCDAPASAEDTIPKYCEKHGFEFESIKLEDKGYWEIFIQKP